MGGTGKVGDKAGLGLGKRRQAAKRIAFDNLLKARHRRLRCLAEPRRSPVRACIRHHVVGRFFDLQVHLFTRQLIAAASHKSCERQEARRPPEGAYAVSCHPVAD